MRLFTKSAQILNLLTMSDLMPSILSWSKHILHPNFARTKLIRIYHLLEPDNTTIQVDGRLVKLDNHLMEFFLFNLMIAMFYTHWAKKIYSGEYIRTEDFVVPLSNFPDQILPERRKKRSYISSILSKNEINRDDKYNRKLFLRVKRGSYIISPFLSVRIAGEWRNIYDLLLIDLLANETITEGDPELRQFFNNLGKANFETFKKNVNHWRTEGSVRGSSFI